MQNTILGNKEKETKAKPKHTKQQNKQEKASLPEPPEQLVMPGPRARFQPYVLLRFIDNFSQSLCVFASFQLLVLNRS